MDGAATWTGVVNEDSSFSVLARITSLDGTGSEVVPGEGNVLKQADISTITCKVFNLGTNEDNEAGTEVTPAPTLTPVANVFDTLRTVGWALDLFGYNFRHDVGVAYVADGDEFRLLEYRVTLTGGGVIMIKVKVKALAIQTS